MHRYQGPLPWFLVRSSRWPKERSSADVSGKWEAPPSSGITLADTLALGVVTNIVKSIVDGIIPDAKDVVSLVEPAMFIPTATTDIQSPSNHKVVLKVVQLHRPWERQQR